MKAITCDMIMSETQYQPAGPVRPNQIYVSWRLYKALSYVARASVDAECSTREGVVEKVLGDWLIEEHPEIMTWLQQREDDQKAFLAKLKPIPFLDTK